VRHAALLLFQEATRRDTATGELAREVAASQVLMDEGNKLVEFGLQRFRSRPRLVSVLTRIRKRGRILGRFTRHTMKWLKHMFGRTESAEVHVQPDVQWAGSLSLGR
jgi:hypothetical protein